MLAVSAAARPPDGRTPIFGDNDSGRVLPAGFDRAPTHDNLLWLAAVLCTGLRPLAGPPDPEVAWTLGVPEGVAAGSLPHAEPLADHAAFTSGGLYVLDGGGTHVVARCGDIGQNGNGGHAHNDLLSYELSRGRPLIVDSGNYAYTFDLAARNEGRSTRAHNAVSVDGEEINPIPVGEAFKLRQVARPAIESWAPGGATGELAASHDGFTRLPGVGAHRRTFALDRASGELVVRDEIEGDGEHTVESFLHFHPDVRASLDGDGVLLDAGDETLRVELEGASEAPRLIQGWVSDMYGTRRPGQVLVATYRGTLP